MRTLFLLLVFTTGAAACSCTGFASAKAAWQGTTLVIIGEVENTSFAGDLMTRLAAFVTSLLGDAPSGPRLVTVRALEAFKGARTGQVYELLQPASPCTIQFREGEEYVIYAVRNSSGEWSAVSTCGGSRHIDGAYDDLRFLRALPGSAAGTRLSGTVEGRPGIRVRVLDAAGRLAATAITGADSMYEVYRLPPGRYTVEPVVQTPSRYAPVATGRDPYRSWVELRPDGGESVSFYASNR